MPLPGRWLIKCAQGDQAQCPSGNHPPCSQVKITEKCSQQWIKSSFPRGQLLFYQLDLGYIPLRLRVSSVAQSRLTLCNLVDHSPPGSSVHGNFQARITERLPLPAPGDLSGPGIKLASPASTALADRLFTTEPPGKPPHHPLTATKCRVHAWHNWESPGPWHRAS